MEAGLLPGHMVGVAASSSLQAPPIRLRRPARRLPVISSLWWEREAEAEAPTLPMVRDAAAAAAESESSIPRGLLPLQSIPLLLELRVEVVIILPTQGMLAVIPPWSLVPPPIRQ